MPEDEEVGYRKPPRKSRFRKGVSGNPSGRPKERRSFASDLITELDLLTCIGDDKNAPRISRQRQLARSLVDVAIRGDVRATNTIISMTSAVPNSEDGLSDEAREAEQKAFEAYVEREQRKRIVRLDDDDIEEDIDGN